MPAVKKGVHPTKEGHKTLKMELEDKSTRGPTQGSNFLGPKSDRKIKTD